MKNKLVKVLSIASVVGLTVACSDSFLDTPPQGTLNAVSLASSEAGVDATLISAYKSLGGWTGNWSKDTWGTAASNWVFDLGSDDTHKGSEPGDGDGMLEFELYQWQPANGVLEAKWVAMYEGVARANGSIATAKEFVAKNPGKAAFGKAAIAQATFLRAFFHFELYKIFKNVPYYTEADAEFNKANTEPVLPLIIKDLEAAIADLPAKKTDAGRVDKMVATAYLGKVQLFAGDFTKALAAFNTVINSGNYALQDCFYDNFSVAKNNSSESLFAVQTSVNDGDGDGGNSNFGERLAFPHGGSPFGCCGFKNPTMNLANAYKVNADGTPNTTTWNDAAVKSTDLLDPRIDFTIGRTGVPYLDYGNHSDSWIRGQGYAGFFSPKKNVHSNKDAFLNGSWAGTQLSALNVELMRYSDVLLMAAEAEVEVGSLANAQKYVNQIRKRAGNCAQAPNGSASITTAINNAAITYAKYKVSEYSGTWTDKAAARTAVRLERRLELATEGHRMFDLQRWGTYVEVLNKYSAVEKTRASCLATVAPVTTKNLMQPIPLNEIQLSGGALTQNPGY